MTALCINKMHKPASDLGDTSSMRVSNGIQSKYNIPDHKSPPHKLKAKRRNWSS